MKRFLSISPLIFSFLFINMIIIMFSDPALALRKLPWKASGYLYAELEKNINGGWTLAAPVIETTITKVPLLVDFEGRMDYTMARGGHGFNHHSVRGELHTGLEWHKLWITYSVGLIYWIEGNDERVPAGFEGVNTLRAGIVF